MRSIISAAAMLYYYQAAHLSRRHASFAPRLDAKPRVRADKHYRILKRAQLPHALQRRAIFGAGIH